jgi:hypothetical protein
LTANELVNASLPIATVAMRGERECAAMPGEAARRAAAILWPSGEYPKQIDHYNERN